MVPLRPGGRCINKPRCVWRELEPCSACYVFLLLAPLYGCVRQTLSPPPPHSAPTRPYATSLQYSTVLPTKDWESGRSKKWERIKGRKKSKLHGTGRLSDKWNHLSLRGPLLSLSFPLCSAASSDYDDDAKFFYSLFFFLLKRKKIYRTRFASSALPGPIVLLCPGGKMSAWVLFLRKKKMNAWDRGGVQWNKKKKTCVNGLLGWVKT